METQIIPTTPLVGCAGWSVPREVAGQFPAAGSHLERYAARFACVEINSSFYRPHKPETYRRWAEAVPEGFCFAVKVPKAITHERRLRESEALLEAFLFEAGHLGERLGPLLVQLPPSLAFDPAVAEGFFRALRGRHAGPVACEPRHASWLARQAEELLVELRVGRVAADPAPAPGFGGPAGWAGLAYYRLHGSPRMYYSAYDDAYLARLARKLDSVSAAGSQAWCIFDNTAAFAAVPNALALIEGLARRTRVPGS